MDGIGERCLAKPAWLDLIRRIEGHIGDRSSAAGLRVMRGNLHFSQRPYFVGDLHDVLDLEFFEKSAFFIMAADLHECAEFFMNPDIDHLIAAGSVLGFVDADLVA